MTQQTNQQTAILDVRPTPGRLPSLWDRQVIFVANLLGLFFGNDRETGVLREQVGHLETYGGRLVPILDLLFHGAGPNLLLLEHAPHSALLPYFSRDLGLRLPEVEVLSHPAYRTLTGTDDQVQPEISALLERMEAHGGEWLDGFVTDPALERLANLLKRKTISARQSSWYGNNKLLLHQHLAEVGLPVFDTLMAAHPAQVPGCLKTLGRQGYRRAAVKAQIGASGIGIIRVSTENPGHIPDYLFFEGSCLVQGWLDDEVTDIQWVGSPSVQLFVGDASLHLYDLTEQILSKESVHEGNMAPPPWLKTGESTGQELLHQAEVTGRWLHAQGYRGTASVDFHVVDRAGRREVRVCEVNARVTGATYPSLLARHFQSNGAWLMRNLRFAAPLEGEALLEALDGANLLYRSGQRPGILPINVNTNPAGQINKGQFLCLSKTAGETRDMFDQARRLLPLRGEYDRD
jgi:hypothetical protein